MVKGVKIVNLLQLHLVLVLQVDWLGCLCAANVSGVELDLIWIAHVQKRLPCLSIFGCEEFHKPTIKSKFGGKPFCATTCVKSSLTSELSRLSAEVEKCETLTIEHEELQDF